MIKNVNDVGHLRDNLHEVTFLISSAVADLGIPSVSYRFVVVSAVSMKREKERKRKKAKVERKREKKASSFYR